MNGFEIGAFCFNGILVIVIFVIIWFLIGLRTIRPREKGLIERFGKYKKTAEQGLHWIIPGIDRMVRVDITENMVDVEPQKIITCYGNQQIDFDVCP